MSHEEFFTRYGFFSTDAADAALARIEQKIESAELANDEAWHIYNARVAIKANTTMAEQMIDMTAKKIEELCKIREELEAKLEEMSREETRREQKGLEAYLRR